MFPNLYSFRRDKTLTPLITEHRNGPHKFGEYFETYDEE